MKVKTPRPDKWDTNSVIVKLSRMVINQFRIKVLIKKVWITDIRFIREYAASESLLDFLVLTKTNFLNNKKAIIIPIRYEINIENSKLKNIDKTIRLSRLIIAEVPPAIIKRIAIAIFSDK